MASTEDSVRADLVRTTTVHAIDGAFAEHMKVLFATFIRHTPDMDQARVQFRKDLKMAQQVRSEMIAIANEQ
jgi:hypothetical protein